MTPLLEILIALSVVGVVAGVVAPFVFTEPVSRKVQGTCAVIFLAASTCMLMACGGGEATAEDALTFEEAAEAAEAAAAAQGRRRLPQKPDCAASPAQCV